MEKQGLSFPKLGTPEQIIYEFDEQVDRVFDELLNLIGDLTYSRYKTLAYLKNPTEEERSLMVGQMNLKGFMKTLLIKRLESSFYAFKKSVERFKESYTNFIEMYRTGNIYINTKKGFSNWLEKVPFIGKSLKRGLEKIRDSFKYLIISGVFFEKLGFTYLGPIDGHDLSSLIEHLKRLNQQAVFLHQYQHT
jgi:hypothetical protein